MSNGRVYDLEEKRAAVAAVLERLKSGGTSKAAILSVADEKRVGRESLRQWVGGRRMERGTLERPRNGRKPSGKPAKAKEPNAASQEPWTVSWEHGDEGAQGSSHATLEVALGQCASLAATPGVSNVRLWQEKKIKFQMTATIVEEE